MAEKTCLVTGATGFIATHLVQYLLEQGYTVRATVRILPNKPKKVRYLMDLREKHGDRLTLCRGNLVEQGSFDEAMQGSTTVFHVASPFLLEEQIKNAHEQVIAPAVEGMRNVLGSVARTASVRTVVVTSTVGACMGDYADVEDGVLKESDWNGTSTPEHNAYHYSKTVAEREAWKAYEAQGGDKRWRLVTINSGFVLGPSLSPLSKSGSLFMVDELLRGWLFFGVPDLSFSCVDVRDLVKAHVAAAENADAQGRYLVAQRTMTSFLKISQTMRQLCGGSWLLPTHMIPTVVVRVVGPLFGLSQKFITRNIGVVIEVDNHRSIEELGVNYRPIEETLHDHYTSWLEHYNAPKGTWI